MALVHSEIACEKRLKKWKRKKEKKKNEHVRTERKDRTVSASGDYFAAALARARVIIVSCSGEVLEKMWI